MRFDTIDELKRSLKSLNNAKLGSFGEQLFARFVAERLHLALTSTHRGGTDFMLMGIPVDVGTTCKFMDQAYRPAKIRGKDVSVLVFDDCCSIIFPEGVLPHGQQAPISWSFAQEVFSQWSANHMVQQSRRMYTE